MLDLAGKLWTSPNTLVGLTLGVAGLPFGARIAIGHNAIQFLDYPWGGGALALGNAILYGGGLMPSDRLHLYDSAEPLLLGRHEEAHTYQAQLLGPLFVPVYLLCGGVNASNRLEQAANRYARGGAWW